MTGDIVQKMCHGIENSDVVVVFVTQRYLEKVASDNTKDNCQLEFKYAARLAGPNMISVVMEERMSVSHSWSGPVGFNLGGHLYTKMWEDADLDGTGMEALIAEVLSSELQHGCLIRWQLPRKWRSRRGSKRYAQCVLTVHSKPDCSHMARLTMVRLQCIA